MFRVIDLASAELRVLRAGHMSGGGQTRTPVLREALVWKQ